MASVVEICNSALNQLGASTILSLTENSKNGRLMNARYETIRDNVLRSHPWNSAVKRRALAAESVTPAWGFKKQYVLPSDCLRLLQLENYDHDYKIEGRRILTNDTTCKILYIARITDPNEMDVMLRETISAAIAADVAYAVTANSALAERYNDRYLLKLKDAKHTDATEGYNTDPTLGQTDVILTEDFINSRL